MTSNNNKKEKKMKMQLAQSTIRHTDLRVIDIHNRQVVVRWSTQKVIGFADNGGFSQDPLRVRYFQNLLDLYNIDGVWHA